MLDEAVNKPKKPGYFKNFINAFKATRQALQAKKPKQNLDIQLQKPLDQHTIHVPETPQQKQKRYFDQLAKQPVLTKHEFHN